MKYLIDALPGQLHGEVVTTDVTVSGGPTLLPAEPQKGRKDFILTNGSAVTIWVGGSTVSDANGLPVEPGATFSSQLGRSKLWATTAGTTVAGIRVLEVS